MPKLTETQDRILEIVLIVLFFLLLRNANPMPPSDDLRALWMAGRFFDEGAAGIYAASGDYFRMVPPDLWISTFIAEGTERPSYPFIYPPLWAWLMHQIVAVTSFEQFSSVMAVINAAAVVGCFYLASRMARDPLPRTAYLGVVIFIIFSLGCLVVALPLQENQPQILVSFLVLLGIERDRAGHPWAGGAAMGLAAAIKLYPVIFAILWLAAGRKQTVAAFAIFGGALGLLSLLVGGWSLHLVFLTETRAIASSVLITFANVTMESIIAAFFVARENTELVSTFATGGETNWRVFAKPPLWQLVSTLIQITTVAALIVYAKRTKLADPLAWPVIFVALAWVLPLSWIYHYLTAFAFLPALIARFGWIRGFCLLFLPVLVTSSELFAALVLYDWGRTAIYPFVGLGMIWLAIAFLWATRTSPVKPPL